MTAHGKSFPLQLQLPLAPAEVGLLIGHRPFGLRGRDYSSCPEAAVAHSGPSDRAAHGMTCHFSAAAPSRAGCGE